MSLAQLILKHDQLAAIGLVAAASASLEATIELSLSFLTGLDEDECGLLLTGKTLGPKLELLKRLGLRRLKSAEAQGAFAAMMDSLSSLIGERNAVIHGTWQPKDGFTFAFLAQLNTPVEVEAVLKKRNGNVQKVNAENLGSLADRLSSAHSAFFDFLMDHFVRPGS